MKIVAGIDVGKRELVVSVSGGPVRIKNEVGGIRGLAEWLPDGAGGVRGHGGLRSRAEGQGIGGAPASEPGGSFAQASGQGATDRQVLVLYGEVFEVEGQPVRDSAAGGGGSEAATGGGTPLGERARSP